MPIQIGGTGLNFSTATDNYKPVTLLGAQAYLVPPGQYIIDQGRYTTLEYYDPIFGFWRARAPTIGPVFISCDGTNWRLINRTGTPVGAVLTNVGSAYTSAPTVVEATTSGGSLWQAFVGGSINTTVTTTTAGKYNYIPTLRCTPSPAVGGTATMTVALSSGGLGTVTVVNAGYGYTKAPLVTIVPDPREYTVTPQAAFGGVITVNATLANSGAVTGVICTDPGTAVVTSLPTLTFSGGGGTSAAATVIMNWTATGMTVGTGGAAYGTSLPFIVTGVGLKSKATVAATDVNPANELDLTIPRNFWFNGTSTGGGAVTATGLVIDDAGFGIQRVPDGVVLTASVTTTAAVVTITVGATTDTSYLWKVKV